MESLETALWAFHLIIIIALVVTILLQRSEGGALGIGGSSGGDSLVSGRSAGNVLTKVTTYLGVLFFVTSISLAYLAKVDSTSSTILTNEGATTDQVSVPTGDADKAAAEKSLGDLLNSTQTEEPSVPTSN